MRTAVIATLASAVTLIGLLASPQPAMESMKVTGDRHLGDMIARRVPTRKPSATPRPKPTPRPRPTPRPSPTPSSTPTPPACARPNIPATLVRAVEPDTPALSQQQGISGTVQVLVSLDEHSRVIGVRLQSSPSAILNMAALKAARESTYQTEIRDCKPVSSEVIFRADFVSQ